VKTCIHLERLSGLLLRGFIYQNWFNSFIAIALPLAQPSPQARLGDKKRPVSWFCLRPFGSCSAEGFAVKGV